MRQLINVKPGTAASWRRAAPFTVMAVAIGILVVGAIRAAGPLVAFEPELGSLTPGASSVAVTGASGGSVVKFSASATPTPTPPPGTANCPNPANTPGGSDGMGGCFPGPHNTGYPHGLPGDTRTPVTLTPYTGSCTVGAGQTVVIDRKNIDCSSEGFFVYGTLTITNSLVKGEIYENSDNAVLNLTDVEVNGLQQLYFPTVGGARNITALRVNSYGGQHTFMCYGNCNIQDSWAHDQTEGGTGPHQNGFLSNDGSNYILRHNSMYCATSGCTSDIAFTADGDTDNIVVDKNLFVASPGSSYCLNAASNKDKIPQGMSRPAIFTRVRVTNNVFQRGTTKSSTGTYKGQYACAAYGPLGGWDPPTTTAGTNGYQNEWTNNKWDDGTVLGANP